MQRRTIYHIIFWAGYVFFKGYLNFESGVGYKDGESMLHFFLLSVAVQAIFLTVKLPLVYSLFFITGKYLAKQWSMLRSILFALLLFSIATIGFICLNYFIVLKSIYHMQTSMSNYLMPGSIIYTFFILSFVSGIALAIKLVRLNIRQIVSEQKILKQKLETELRFLKAQTNPHFLFNTLNNIYALARKKSDDTADVVMKLSKLLRFMLYESERETIPVCDELKVIEDYIELEKIRYSDRLTVSYANSIDNPGQPIAPLILLPFVENAFKHGASETRFSSYIDIDVQLKQGQLDFVIENSKTENAEKVSTEKIGLGNVSRQLELMYPEHILVIENENERFKIILKINLLKHATV